MEEQDLKELGTPEAFDEMIRRNTQLRTQVKLQRQEWLREALPDAIAAALRQARLYHCSVLIGRCGVESCLH
jgi:hypothetical protein